MIRIASGVDIVVEHERPQERVLSQFLILKHFLCGVQEQLQCREPLLAVDQRPGFGVSYRGWLLSGYHRTEEVNARGSLCGTRLSATIVQRLKV